VFGASVPILGCAGDQHAATIGQACFKPGMVKATYGTGLFAVLNTGSERIQSKNRLLTTLAYRLDGKPTYALEGSVFIAGAAVQWLRDGLKLIENAPQVNDLANRGVRGRSRWCRPLSVLARPIGTRTRAGRSSASPATPDRKISPMPCWKALPSRPAICSTPWRATGPKASAPCCASTAA
jgi:hypothetical protein